MWPSHLTRHRGQPHQLDGRLSAVFSASQSVVPMPPITALGPVVMDTTPAHHLGALGPKDFFGEVVLGMYSDRVWRPVVQQCRASDEHGPGAPPTAVEAMGGTTASTKGRDGAATLGGAALGLGGRPTSTEMSASFYGRLMTTMGATPQVVDSLPQKVPPKPMAEASVVCTAACEVVLIARVRESCLCS
jgi:hypothetical protein